jgi:hypothetical protein
MRQKIDLFGRKVTMITDEFARAVTKKQPVKPKK